MPRSKFEDSDSGKPSRVVDDPYAELFADCTTPEQVLELQREIEQAEGG
jgi:hypothetical protein